MDSKKDNCSISDDSCSNATADELHTAKLKKAVEIVNDDDAPEHQKKAADELISTTAKDAKKAEQFEPKKPDVVPSNK